MPSSLVARACHRHTCAGARGPKASSVPSDPALAGPGACGLSAGLTVCCGGGRGQTLREGRPPHGWTRGSFGRRGCFAPTHSPFFLHLGSIYTNPCPRQPAVASRLPALASRAAVGLRKGNHVDQQEGSASPPPRPVSLARPGAGAVPALRSDPRPRAQAARQPQGPRMFGATGTKRHSDTRWPNLGQPPRLVRRLSAFKL